MENTKLDLWPVIIHQSLEDSDIGKYLSQAKFKIKVAANTVENTVIFPLSSIAFMVVSLGQDMPALFNSLEKLVHVHAHCYLVTVSSLYGAKEFELLSRIQTRFVESQLQTIPVHNSNEAIKAMTSIAKVLCKPTCNLMHSRLEAMVEETKSCDALATILHHIGLDKHQIRVVQDRLGSLACLVTADQDDLIDCSLDTETVTKILQYFGNT